MRITFLSLGLVGLWLVLGCQNSELPTSADSATPASFGRFEGAVVAAWNDDGRNMTLREDFAYFDPQGRHWPAPSGTAVDGASIPSAFWTFIGGPFEGQYRNASVVHDVGCVEMTERWEDVHRMFYEACRCAGVSEAKAKMLYYAVYHFGPRWQTVTETRSEMRQNAAGQMVEQEVTEELMVRIDPPPPTAEEVEQVEALIEEDNPDLSVIKQTDRESLRRRPRRGPSRTRTDDGSDIAVGPREGADPNGRKRPEFAADRNMHDRKPVENADARMPVVAEGKRPVRENGYDGRSGSRGPRTHGQQDAADLPAVTSEEQEFAVERVREHIEKNAGEQRPAEYEVERTRDGYRVTVEYQQLDENGQPTGETNGASTIRISRSGQLREMISGR
ncbi:MAG: DUF1353 domain-containing protein [Patescibacteria group bacterium]|nr:DUF1353 domain-containing protein [Patescibacteria group bacterium]